MKCPQCKMKFKPGRHNQRFCSSRCKWTWDNANRNLKPNVRFQCEVCSRKVERYVSPSVFDKNAFRFCSRKCKGIAMRGIPQQAQRIRLARIQVTSLPIGQLKAGQIILRKSRPPAIPDTRLREVDCEYCGERFYRHNIGRVFCSTECRWRAGAKNRDRQKQNAYNRSYRYKHKAKFKRLYREAFYGHRPKKLESRDRYRARKMNAAIYDLTEAQWREIKRQHQYRCIYCGKRCRLTKDHLIPLSRGGNHTASNIAPACKSCNSRKWNRTPEEFLNGKF